MSINTSFITSIIEAWYSNPNVKIFIQMRLSRSWITLHPSKGSVRFHAYASSLWHVKADCRGEVAKDPILIQSYFAHFVIHVKIHF